MFQDTENKIGSKVKFIDLDANYHVTIENVKKAITPNTKIIALAQVTNVYHFKGSCKAAALPSEGNIVGDTWNLEDASSYGPAGVNVAWTGTEWDSLSGDMNYMRGLHDPDWSGIKSSAGGVSSYYWSNLFKVPARGSITIYGSQGVAFYINGTEIFPTDSNIGDKFISAPVNKNDDFKAKGEGNYYYVFVPYKVQ